jgi:phosphocarrier protein HPr
LTPNSGSGVSREVAISNQRGLHARASARFVNLASELATPIEVEKDGHRVCGTSIMGLMMLGAAMGDTITIHVEGDGADEALRQLVELVEERFGEE